MASSNSPALILPPSPPNLATGELVHTDLRIEQVHIPSSWAWLAWLLGAAALLAAIWHGVKKWRARVQAVPAIVIPPHRKAKDRLRNAGELLSDPYRFCSLVSDVVRVYLEERFTLHAPDRTTEEFLAELRGSSSLSADHQALLEDFLTQCDLVKFARHEPSIQALQALLDSALRLIDETAEVAAAAGQPEQEVKAA